MADPLWFTAESALACPPSVAAGISVTLDRRVRAAACQLIQQAGILLRLPQTAIATSQVLFHRFFFRQPFQSHLVCDMAIASLFVASKREECGRSVRDTFNVWHHLLLRQAGRFPASLDLHSAEYSVWRDILFSSERLLLKELGFVLLVEHPHKFLLSYCNLLECEPEVSQKAWNFCDDCLRSGVCCQYRPEAIAAACVWLTCRFMDVVLPEPPLSSQPWWLLYDVSIQELQSISEAVLELYTYPPSERDDEVSTLFSGVDRILSMPVVLPTFQIPGEQVPAPPIASSNDIEESEKVKQLKRKISRWDAAAPASIVP